MLYLPVLKRNSSSGIVNAGTGSLGTILIAATNTTNNDLDGLVDDEEIGAYINGNNGTSKYSPIRVDQGIDNDSSSGQKLDSDLTETQYMIEIDNRLGTIVGGQDVSISSNIVDADASFIDDDQIAVYYLSQGTDSPGFVNSIPVSTNSDTSNTVLRGAVGTELHFSIKASLDLNNSGNFLFTRLGSTMTIDTKEFYYIDTNVRISGVTTGYRIDIPVRFVKSV